MSSDLNASTQTIDDIADGGNQQRAISAIKVLAHTSLTYTKPIVAGWARECGVKQSLVVRLFEYKFDQLWQGRGRDGYRDALYDALIYTHNKIVDLAGG